jgi:GTP-binding protein Era
MGEFKSGFVGLLGVANVGKSTLMNQVLGEKVSITSPKPQTTRTRILGILTRPASQMVFVDTPGLHKAHDPFNRLLVQTALSALREVDVICFLVDAAPDSEDTHRAALQCLHGTPKPVLLAINKIDLVRKKDLLPLIDHYRRLGEFEAIVPLSALTGDGVDRLLAEIERLLPKGPRYYPEDSLTDQPERALVAEMVREKVFHFTHQEIPYAVAVTVERFQEDEVHGRIVIDATIHVERESQKAILIGKDGHMLKQIGSTARLDMERLLGCRVYLGLFVRVQKNWRRDPRARARFGYAPERS